MNSTIYSRTISKEEASEGYFMVLKDHLAFFPIGSSFDLARGASSRKSEVESRPCTCRGEDKPHRHYVVRCGGLRAGDRVTIRKDAKKPQRYVMQVRSAMAQQEFCG